MRTLLLSAIFISTNPPASAWRIILPSVNLTSDHSAHEEKLTRCQRCSRPWANFTECVASSENHWSVSRLTEAKRTRPPPSHTQITLVILGLQMRAFVCCLLVSACWGIEKEAYRISRVKLKKQNKSKLHRKGTKQEICSDMGINLSFPGWRSYKYLTTPWTNKTKKSSMSTDCIQK